MNHLYDLYTDYPLFKAFPSLHPGLTDNTSSQNHYIIFILMRCIWKLAEAFFQSTQRCCAIGIDTNGAELTRFMH